jgi:hypothetical protein
MDKAVDELGLCPENGFLTCFIPALGKALVFRVKSRVNRRYEVLHYGPLPLTSGTTLPTYEGSSVTVPASGVIPARAYTKDGLAFPTTLSVYDKSDMWYLPTDDRDRLFHVIQYVTPAFLRIDVQIPTGVTQGRFQKDRVTTGVDKDFGFSRGTYEIVHLPGIRYGYRYGNDSVPGYSPVIIKQPDGFVDILPIEDLWNAIPSQPYAGEPKGTGVEEIKDVPFDLYVYSPYQWYKWTRVKRIIRHQFKGELVRIRTVGGVVDVTPNHSVFKRRGDNNSTTLTDASTIKPGDRLRMARLDPLESPSHFVGTEDLAWLYGFFAAEGTATEWKTHRHARFYNKDEELLEKVRAIAELNFHKRIHGPYYSREAHVSFIDIEDKQIYNHFKTKFYTGDGKKRVPTEILNAPARVKEAFLLGYDKGDGSHGGLVNPKNPIEMFTTNSWSLAMGLLWLMRSVYDQSWSVWTRADKPDVVQIEFTNAPYTIKPIELPNGHKLEDREVVKSVTRVPYEGFVYDLDTENGKFVTGVGGIVVHNTNVNLYTSVKFTYGEYIIEIPRNSSLIFDIIVKRVPSHWITLPINYTDPSITRALTETYGFEGFPVYRIDERDKAIREYDSLLGGVKI